MMRGLSFLPGMGGLDTRVAYRLLVGLYDLAVVEDGWYEPSVREFREASHDPQRAISLDIVFLHGLGGDHVDTWLYEREDTGQRIWPGELRQHGQIPTRVLTVEYSSALLRRTGGSDQDLSAIGEYVADALEQYGVGARPTIYVAHSLGGLVIKAALVTDARRQGKLCKTAAGVMFFGTPHKGSKLASLARLLDGFTGLQWRSRILQVLERDFGEGPLNSLHSDFRDWVLSRHKRIQLAAFAEERFKALDDFVVDRDSAHGDFAAYGDRAILGTIPADHVSMTKFPPGSPAMGRVFSILRDWSSSTPPPTVPEGLTPEPTSPPSTSEELTALARGPLKGVRRLNGIRRALVGAGFVILSMSIAGAAYFYSQPYRAMPFVAKLGVIGGYESANDYLASALARNIELATHEITFSGVDFHISSADKRRVVLDALCRGVRVRYLVLDPESADVAATARHFSCSKDEMLSIMKSSLSSLRTLNGMWENRRSSCASPGELDVRLSQDRPTFRAYMFDPSTSGEMYVVPYISRMDAPETPGFRYVANRGSLSQIYTRSVETLWSDATPAFSSDERSTGP